MTEYLYDKENPKSHLRYKPQGWESFYRGMPNELERAELIGRRLLKDYDGDLAKISLVTKKPYDPGQKWRSLKNTAKFVKNPFGLIAWRFVYHQSMRNMFSYWYLWVGFCIWGILENLAAKQTLMSSRVEIYRWMRGQRNTEPLHQFNDRRKVVGPDTTSFKKKVAIYNGTFKNPSSNCTTSAYWCRDQNFRKYFEIRKRHGIEPSIDYKNYYGRDLIKPYYNGLLQASWMEDDVVDVTATSTN